MSLTLEGGCYCGQVRYVTEGEPVVRIQCHCRECMYITGGSPTEILAMPVDGFRVTQGATRSFTRTDIPNPVTREFCPNCGTHLLSRAPSMPAAVLIKIGSLDDPSVYGTPNIALYTREKLAFHSIPEGTRAFETLPKR
jgi:hypothetical protein